MVAEAPRYLVVEGPIGVGKTTLARRLAASFGSELVLEMPQDNPFLARFYQDRTASALPTQLYFLFQRLEQLRGLRQGDLFEPVRVGDYLLEKDRIFARLTLGPEELELYEKIYRQVVSDLPRPDLVVYLQAPLEVLLQRIRRRGIDYERNIDERYLQRLCNAYVRFFHDYQEAPLLIVNTESLDLAGSDEDYRMLLERVRSMPAGRHYFNPGRLALEV
ncbi:MAG: deoxynucleoside kinase [Gammaproteobacteria bacterium]|nr:MAG: deoxynucleoside kinase [Gammaproteobacteria bacterium]